MAMVDQAGFDVLRDAIARIRKAKLPHTREDNRDKAVAILEHTVTMILPGQPVGPHEYIALANVFHLAYSIGKLDGMREMMDNTTGGS